MIVLIGVALVASGGLGGLLFYRYKMKQLTLAHERAETKQLNEMINLS